MLDEKNPCFEIIETEKIDEKTEIRTYECGQVMLVSSKDGNYRERVLVSHEGHVTGIVCKPKWKVKRRELAVFEEYLDELSRHSGA